MATIIPNSNAFAVGANTAVSQMQMLEDWRKHAMTTLNDMYKTHAAMRSGDAKNQLARRIYELENAIYNRGADTGDISSIGNVLLGGGKNNMNPSAGTYSHLKATVFNNPYLSRASSDVQRQYLERWTQDFGGNVDDLMKVFQEVKKEKSDKSKQNQGKIPGTINVQLWPGSYGMTLVPTGTDAEGGYRLQTITDLLNLPTE